LLARRGGAGAARVRARRARGRRLRLDERGAVDGARPLELWITARMTHCFALGELLGMPGCGPLADHGLAAIDTTFADDEHGGWYGEPGLDAKEAYPHAFVLLAGASASLAGRPGGRELLEAAAAVIEQRFWSGEEGACVEAWERAWEHPEPYRGANANMHMVEAFLAAGDALGDGVWARRALRIAERLIERTARAHEWRVIEHFDAEWRPRADYNADQPDHPFRPFGATPGHGLEWARLLLHLRAALHDPPAWLLPAARALFECALEDGWRAPGGIVYTTDLRGRPVIARRLHWVLAEAIGAAAALHATTGEEGYERWYRRAWDVVDLHFRDRAHGSWRHELDERLAPVTDGTWSGKPDVYHALQATLLPRLHEPPGDRLKSERYGGVVSDPVITRVVAIEELPPGSRATRRLIAEWSDGSQSEAIAWFSDLCGCPHKSLYADSCVMPT
jgi:sulfoquinovose isomerase